MMLFKLSKPFIVLIVVGYLIMVCTVLLEGNLDILNNTTLYLPHKKTSNFKMEKAQNENLQRTTQSLDTATKHRNDDKKDYVGRLSRQEPKIWDQWGYWSSCSVTCGVGKIARWRHCIAGSCYVGEKKAQLKTCTLSAC